MWFPSPRLRLSCGHRASTTNPHVHRPTMTPRPHLPREGTHPVVKAAAALVVLAAAGAGLWAGSSGAPPRPVPIDPAPAPRGLFLPAAEPEPSTLPGAERGAALFEERCAECHTVGGDDRRGPDLARAALRRNPAWVRAMVASPDSMFEADSVAQWVLEVHGIEPEQATMENPDLGALVTFLRSFDPAR